MKLDKLIDSNKKYWFHVSDENIGLEKDFTPRKPFREYEEEKDLPKRICVAANLVNCIIGKIGEADGSVKRTELLNLLTIGSGKSSSFFWRKGEKFENVENMAVYVTEEEPVPPTKMIVDFALTGEHWFLKETKFKRIGYINSGRLINKGEIVLTNKRVQSFVLRENFLKDISHSDLKVA